MITSSWSEVGGGGITRLFTSYEMHVKSTKACRQAEQFVRGLEEILAKVEAELPQVLCRASWGVPGGAWGCYDKLKGHEKAAT